jgi:hypothetical protein
VHVFADKIEEDVREEHGSICMGSFTAMDGLLREMKPLLAPFFEYRGYLGQQWYIPLISELGYRTRGEWFYDSLIQVNQLLWQEEEQGIVRRLPDNPYIQDKPHGEALLARVYGDCYHYLHGGYSYRLRVNFWLEKGTERERLSDGYDVTAMVTLHNDVWPRIVGGFGLFPKRYERKEQTC